MCDVDVDIAVQIVVCRCDACTPTIITCPPAEGTDPKVPSR
ncbi:uncharacterized protein METZ01_LOCUS276357 [marine metagenome]|uniref:Uncharacterized protein n=1 Tax=marine metagenome TaxID=408172 RepID=A0A382KJB9_9ZZZZ